MATLIQLVGRLDGPQFLEGAGPRPSRDPWLHEGGEPGGRPTSTQALAIALDQPAVK